LIVYRYLDPISGTWSAPDPSAAPATSPVASTSTLPDPVVTCTVTGVMASATPGLIDFNVAFVIPGYDPTQFNQVVEVHAIYFAALADLPAEASDALATSLPQGSATTHSLFEGVTVPVTIIGCVPGPGVIANIVGFMEPDPSTPAASSSSTPSATPSTTPETTAVVADPSAVATSSASTSSGS
jgi:hypothetical protein